MSKLYTKPSVAQRVKQFWLDYWIAMMFIATVVFAGVLIATYEPPKYLRAPIKACVSTYTGQQKTEQWISYQCASYNNQGVCTVQVPIINEQTYRMVNNQCNWNEWK